MILIRNNATNYKLKIDNSKCIKRDKNKRNEAKCLKTSLTIDTDQKLIKA